MAHIVKKERIVSTAWFDLVAKEIAGQALQEKPYYSLEMSDYVSVLALTAQQQVILVRQFRPAVERAVIELPSGHVEKNESAEASARRELAEETGYVSAVMEPLGSFWSDTGRMSNRIWYFFADNAMPVKEPGPAEPGVDVVLQDLNQFTADVAAGRFESALNLPAVLLAFLKNRKFRQSLLAITNETNEKK